MMNAQEMPILRVISLGAGVQSTTMALMAAHGEITPMPDCAIFADTQAEPKEVYDHLQWLMSPNVLPFPVKIISAGSLASAGLKLRTNRKTGVQYQKIDVPVFTLSKSGKRGITPRQCTTDYKIRPIIRALRGMVGTQNVRTAKKDKFLVESWIGISIDEAIRMKPSRDSWIKHRWPLIEKQMSRRHCLQWMESHGYPSPPRSACVFCPYHNDREWRKLRDEQPVEFAKAVAWERSLQKTLLKDKTMRAVGVFLHRQCVPLDEVDFSTDEDRGQLNLFNNECEGMCGV